MAYDDVIFKLANEYNMVRMRYKIYLSKIEAINIARVKLHLISKVPDTLEMYYNSDDDIDSEYSLCFRCGWKIVQPKLDTYYNSRLNLCQKCCLDMFGYELPTLN